MASQEMLGFADLHLHQFANLAFGGRVLWGAAYGDPAEALAPCSHVHGPHGITDWVGNAGRAAFGLAPWTALLGHDTGGSPGFRGWPAWNDYTHQSVHEQLLKRAVDGGLRLIVVHALHNEVLCRISRRKTADCCDMYAVDLQIQAAYDMQAHVDAASGGPGKGWYRIVRSPDEARQVIASGHLAVVLGLEVDNIFGAYLDGQLTEAGVSEMMEKYYQAGVRHVIPLHFCDNAFGGAAFALSLQWSANNRALSAVNPLSTVPVYRMRTQSAESDGYQYRGGNRNARGLTPLGRHLMTELMGRGMVIDVDHMSAGTRADVLNMAVAAHHPVAAGHAQFLDLCRPDLRNERHLRASEVQLILQTGGTIAPLVRQPTVATAPADVGTSACFLQAYRYLREHGAGGWAGFGTDFNGFAGLPGPGGTAARLEYPFPAPLGGRPMERSTIGERSFDINTDGVAHVGMLPDFLAQLSAGGLSSEETEMLMGSAAGYVDLWDRAQSGTVAP